MRGAIRRATDHGRKYDTMIGFAWASRGSCRAAVGRRIGEKTELIFSGEPAVLTRVHAALP